MAPARGGSKDFLPAVCKLTYYTGFLEKVKLIFRRRPFFMIFCRPAPVFCQGWAQVELENFS